MKTFSTHLFLTLLLGAGTGLGTGCQTRLHLTTGTVIGLHANPGDGQTQPPQITFAYKRAELAVVPTAGKQASNEPPSDAFSSLGLINFKTKWWGPTDLDQFIATGLAAREIQGEKSVFTKAIYTKSVKARLEGENITIKSLVKAVDDGNGKVDGEKLANLLKSTPLESETGKYQGKPLADWETFLKGDARPFLDELKNKLQ